jgi:hypothetical protein
VGNSCRIQLAQSQGILRKTSKIPTTVMTNLGSGIIFTTSHNQFTRSSG